MPTRPHSPSSVLSARAAPPDLFLPIRDPALDALHAATAHYTQDAVVDELLDLAGWPDADGLLLDPGAGDGVFLERAIARLTLDRDDVAALTRRVEAWEIHPDAAHDARARVTRHLVRRGWSHEAATRASARVVIEADFLAPGPTTRRYDCVLGNPPFLRFGNLPDRFKTIYAEVVPDYARADLLHAFLDRCTEVLTDTGVLACVTSDRWLFNANAGALRDVIGQRFGIDALRRLDPTSTFYRPKRRVRGSPPRVHPVAVLLGNRARAARALTRAPILIDADQARPAGTVALGEIADVRIAPWLGPHGVFTLDAAAATHLPTDALVPCVDTEDIGADDRLRAPTRVAIRTSRDAAPQRAVLAHLDATLDRLPPRARRATRWLPPESWGPLPLGREALLIPRIAKGLRVVRLPAGVLPINHNLTVVASIPGVELDTLAAALADPAADAWIRQHAPRLENDYRSITTTLLRRLPVRMPM